jgi:hypothetical protein
MPQVFVQLQQRVRRGGRVQVRGDAGASPLAQPARFKLLLTPAAAGRVAQQDVANRKRRTLDVELDDLASVRGPARRRARHGRSRF